MAAIIIRAASAQAAIVYDASLASPNGIAAGWYDGTSVNPNGGFTIDDENGIEIGQRVKLRQSPNAIDPVNNAYVVPAGSQIGAPTRAAWNYEFAIDLRPGGAGSLTLENVSAQLHLADLTTGVTATVNPLTYRSDDAGFGTGGKYDMSAARSYELDLVVVNSATGVQLASNTILVNVETPEPATLSFIGLGMASIAIFRKRALRN
jgi:hypothetical protein